MKKVILLVFFIVVYSYGLAQTKTENNDNFLVSYQLHFKKFLESDATLIENTVLIISNQGTLFTFESMMKLDSIQQVRELTVSDALLYKSTYYYLIKNEGTATTHYEAIGSDSFKFEEKLNHDWKLINQDSVISGHVCKKAVLNYAGREWSAWYSPKIAVSAGPYKFYGLPGLIMNIKDSEGIFNFRIKEIRKGNFSIDKKIDNYFINEDGKSFEDINKIEFYGIRNKYYQMSLNEKLQYMNRENVAKPTFVIEGTNGEKPRVNSKSKARNFIERYE